MSNIPTIKTVVRWLSHTRVIVNEPAFGFTADIVKENGGISWNVHPEIIGRETPRGVVTLRAYAAFLTKAADYAEELTCMTCYDDYEKKLRESQNES